ncbi:MAG: hypothetical protein H6R10_476 [Rhodocyclaceae bacterium]|nr:hypothetical protein [Rhodocyclaceae bacterium]
MLMGMSWLIAGPATENLIVNMNFAVKDARPASSARSATALLHVLNKAETLQFVEERQDFLDRAAGKNPFASSAWTLHFIREVAGDDWIFVIPHCQDEDESLILLYAERRAPHRLLAVANFYTSLYSPLISSARDRSAAIDALVDRLLARQRDCATVDLGPLDADSPDTAALASAFARHGWYVKRYFRFGNWSHACQGQSFEDYMAGRDGKIRHTWQRKTKKFRSLGPAARLEIITDSQGVEAAMDAYEAVYVQSWKDSEHYPLFVRHWARICAREGWLRLGLAWIGEVPVAAQFWFTLHGRANIFKLAYDQRYAQWSPGTVLGAYLFQYSLDQDRVAEIDYLTGDDSYKRDWMSRRRQRIGLLACNTRTWRGLTQAAWEFAAQLSSPWRRRFLFPGGPKGGISP